MSCSEKWKEARKNKKKRNMTEDKKAKDSEGETYEAGAFEPDGQLLPFTNLQVQETSERKRPVCKKCGKPRRGHKKGQSCPP